MRNLQSAIRVFLLLSCLIPLSWIHADTPFIPITPENAAHIQVVGSRLWPDFGPSRTYFSPDGKQIVTGSYPTWRLWNLSDDTDFDLGKDVIAFISPNWKYFVRTNYSDAPDTLFALSNGMKDSKQLKAFPQYSDFLFSPDEALTLVYDDSQGTYQLWQLPDVTLVSVLPVRRIKEPSDKRIAPVFSPDSKYLAWVNDDGKGTIWEIASKREVATLDIESAKNILCCLAFSADSQTLISSDTPGGYAPNLQHYFYTWEVSTGKQLKKVPSTNLDARRVWLTNNRDFMLLSAYPSQSFQYSDRVLSLWRTDTLQQIPFQLTTDTDFKFLATFSADGKMLAAADSAKSLHIVDATTGKQQAQMSFKNAIESVDFGADSNLIMVSLANQIQLWTWADGQGRLLKTLVGNNAVFSPDGSSIAANINDTRLVYGIANADRGAKTPAIKAKARYAGITLRAAPSVNAPEVGAALDEVIVTGRNPNGTYVYVGDKGGWARTDYVKFTAEGVLDILPVIDATKASLLNTPTPTPSPTESPKFVFTPRPTLPTPSPLMITPISLGDKTISTATLDQVRLMRVAPVPFANFERGSRYGPGVKAKFNLDGTKVLIQSFNGNYFGPEALFVFDPLTAINQPVDLKLDMQSLSAAEFSPDGKYVAVVVEREDQTVKLWNIEKHAFEREFQFQSDNFNQVVFSHDGTRLALGGYDDIRVVDLVTGKSAQIFASGENLVLSQDGALLGIGNAQGKLVSVYDTKTGNLRHTFPGSFAMMFSPNGKTLAVEVPHQDDAFYTQFKLWDLASETMVADLNEVHYLACFSPDSRLLLGMSDNRFLAIDTTTGTIQSGGPIEADYDRVVCSPDGTTLAVNHPLSLVDMRTWKKVPLSGNYNADSLLFSPDGTTLIAGDKLSTMVFAVPNAGQSTWQPIEGTVLSGGTNVYDNSGKAIGVARNKVLVSGRDASGEMVYLPILQGWISVKGSYLSMGKTQVQDLPRLSER